MVSELKLGFHVAERTVSRLIPNRRTPPSQTWRTFLTNHVPDLVSLDFFTVPTARLRVLFVFVVLAHDRRRVLNFNVTEHPTAAWTAQQIVDTFPDDSAPSYLLRDRDSIYGHAFRQRVKGMGISEVLTAPLSPWQNPFAERLVGSIRRECLNHVLVVGESPPAPHPGPLLLLLSPGSHASRARQGCAGRQARRAPRGGQDRGDSRSRWPASPLRPRGGVVQHRRSSLPSNTRHRVHLSRRARLLPVLHRDSGVTVQARRSNDAGRPTSNQARGLGPVHGLTDLGARER